MDCMDAGVRVGFGVRVAEVESEGSEPVSSVNVDTVASFLDDGLASRKMDFHPIELGPGEGALDDGEYGVCGLPGVSRAPFVRMEDVGMTD